MDGSDFTGKTAVITGITGTLGSAMASALAERGADILGQFNRSEEKARALAEELRSAGIKVKMVQSDLSEPGTAASIIREALSLPGRLSFLVNSASVFDTGTLDSVTSGQISEAVTVNALAPLYISREFRKNCRSGVIINMLDARMVDYDKNHVAYSLSKQMLFSLTRMMSIEFAPEIRVNAIAPGMVSTPKGSVKGKLLAGIKKATLLNRTGSSESIAAALIFLLENDFITGETVFVDGGRNIRGKMFGL